MVETWSETHDLVVVDGGDAFSKAPTVADDLRRQAELKAEFQVRSLVADGLQAFVPGKGDLALGTAFLRRMIDEHGLPVLAGNLTCDGRGFEATRVVQAGDRRIGLIGLAGGERRPCQVSDPAAALTAGLEAVGDVDAVVLVLNADRSVATSLVGAADGVDFVVLGGSGQTLKNPRRLEGGAWQLGVGNRGKKLGVVELAWHEGAQGWQGEGEVDAIAKRLDRYRQRVDDMARRAAEARTEDAARQAQVQRGHYQEEVARLEAELAAAVAAAEGGAANRFTHQLVELDSTIPDHPRASRLLGETKAAVNAVSAGAGAAEEPYSGPYIGSSRCSGCHRTEYLQWKGTGHAKAWPTLVNAQRQGDPECISCHATGHRLPEGPTGVAVPSALRGVGCESCHGPGADHAAAPIAAELALPNQASCTQCHDGVKDEGRFDLDRYWPRVVHGAGAAAPE